ncbi:MAG: DEAD/DEAH box helicase, partial [Candidatus Eisenbacteria bacterium]|nr:DEAD/DEAH box helicase [Candidatus Eisenbacteria bacterium]
MARRSRPPSTSPVGGVCPAPGGPGASLLDREVGFLKGVGPGRAALLSKLMIHTIGDLLLHLPRAYLDRRRVVGIDGLAPEMAATVAGEVIGARVRRVRGGRQDLLATVEDGTGRLSVVWFGQPYLSRIVRPGARLLLSGRVRLFQGLCLVNPDFDLAESGQEPVSGRAGILPVYPTTQGLSQRFLRGLAETALRLAGDPGEDPIPRHILDRLDLPPRDRALRAVHFPSTLEEAERSRRRLSFEELLVLQLLLKRAREERSTAASARPLRGDPDRLRAVRDRLPYRLTDEQEDAISAILADLQGERPAMRLLQGEVGSGKTVVAALACAWAASAESQSCVMAPTEVLAIQLAGALRAILDPVGMRVALLLGSTPGRERREILGRLAEGQVDTLVGTHAIIE